MFEVYWMLGMMNDVC